MNKKSKLPALFLVTILGANLWACGTISPVSEVSAEDEAWNLSKPDVSQIFPDQGGLNIPADMILERRSFNEGFNGIPTILFLQDSPRIPAAFKVSVETIKGVSHKNDEPALYSKWQYHSTADLEFLKNVVDAPSISLVEKDGDYINYSSVTRYASKRAKNFAKSQFLKNCGVSDDNTLENENSKNPDPDVRFFTNTNRPSGFVTGGTQVLHPGENHKEIFDRLKMEKSLEINWCIRNLVVRDDNGSRNTRVLFGSFIKLAKNQRVPIYREVFEYSFGHKTGNEESHTVLLENLVNKTTALFHQDSE